MKNPIAFLFPGQGAHHVGMLRPFLANADVKKMISIANGVCGHDIAKLIQEGPEVLDESSNTYSIWSRKYSTRHNLLNQPFY